MLHAILKKSRDVKIPGLLLYRCILFSAFALRKADKFGELLLEEQKKELEADLEQAIQKGRRCGISDEDIKSLFELILEG